MNDYDKLKEISFALCNNKKELADLIMNSTDHFTLNPAIANKIKEIKEMEKLKEELKAVLEEESNGKESNE